MSFERPDEPPLETLIRLMPPPGEAERRHPGSVDGRALPADYGRFIATYGIGQIDAMISVLGPDGMEEETALAREMWDDYDIEKPEGRHIDSESLLAWGVDGGGDIICWVTEAKSPDDWPVIIFSRGDARWVFYQTSTLEFLLKALDEESEDYPLSVISERGSSQPVFEVQ